MNSVDFETLQSCWQRYQVMDFVISLVILIITTVVYLTVPPFCRPFSWNDPAINYPFVEAVTFPIWLIGLWFVFVLFFCLGTIYIFGGPLWPWIKVHFISAAMQQSLVNMLKLYTGRIRPDYLNRLRRFGYNENSYVENKTSGVSVSEYYCRLGDTQAQLREGRLSFPSGHSSFSFAIFTVLALFLFAHLRPSSRGGNFLRLLVSLSPLCIAFLCAVSRTREYWHNFDDVMAGAVIGSGSAMLCFYNSFRITEGGICLARSEVLETEAREEREMDCCPVTVRAI